LKSKDSVKLNSSGPVNLKNKKVVGELLMDGEYGPEVKDIEGTIYKTVFIGTQLWMAENLKVSTYNDGSIISNFQDLKDNDSAGAWGYYYNDSTFNAKYGKLYNWYALNPLANGNKNVCPSGYHVPTDAEWLVLLNYRVTKLNRNTLYLS
jgi:uncharacterized protein (TIGR02145 family)